MSRPMPNSPPIPDDAAVFDCRATAALLRALEPLVWASHVGALVAALQHLWVPLVAWAVVVYLAVRLRLDADLLTLLVTDPHQVPSRLDVWLVRAGLRTTPPPVRGVAERCHGARRWARFLIAACLLQAVATAALLLSSPR